MSRDNRFLALALFLWGCGEGLFFYTQPLYLKELGADPVTIGTLLSLSTLAGALALIPAGYLSDHLGRKRVLSLGWVLGLLITVGMYLAPTLQGFSVAFVAYGSTLFVIAPVNAYAAEARGAQSVQRALTLVPSAFSAGMIFSPSIGGWIGQAWGLRTVFAVSAAAFLLSTLVMLTLRDQPVVPATPGQARYGALFRNQRFLGFLALMFISLGAIYLGFPFAPNFVSEVRGLDLAQIGLLGSLNSAGAMTLSLVFGHRLPRRGFMLAQGLFVAYLALLLLTSGLGWLGAAFFLRASWNLAVYMSRSQVGRVVSPAELGLAFGITETVVQSAAMMAPLAAGVLYRQAPMLPFQVSLGLIALTAPVFWRFAPRRDAHTADEPAGVTERVA